MPEHNHTGPDTPVSRAPVPGMDAVIATEYANTIRRWAVFSPDGRYRYVLGRQWESSLPPKTLTVIGLNPSTATESEDDATVRRCVAFAKREKCDMLVMCNLFAFRAKEPADMKRASDPIGPENDRTLLSCTEPAERRVVLCAWGAHGGYLYRNQRVIALLRQHRRELWHLGLTRQAHPRHPLYLRADALLVLWT